LKWARKTAYYDVEEISKKMNVKVDTFEKWEDTGTINYEKLLKLADYYQRPPMLFFNDDNPEKNLSIIPDYRTIDSKNQENITPSISFELRSAKERRENLLILEDESDEFEIPSFDFPLSEKSLQFPEKLAWDIRSKLKINSAKMNILKGPKSFEYYVKKIEELGVLVFHFYGIKPEEMRGYALCYEKLPIIGINNQDHHNGKKFTLFHELAHILIKKDGISSFDKYYLKNRDEIFCNAVAAEVLVPRKLLLDQINHIPYDDNWTDEKLSRLKKHFDVSEEVIIRRLLTLKIVDDNYYKIKRKKWDNFIPKSKIKPLKDVSGTILSTINDDQIEDNVEDTLSEEEKKKAIYVRKAAMALKRNGTFYTSTVLSAHDSDVITNSSMAGYIGENLQVIEEIRKKLPKVMVE